MESIYLIQSGDYLLGIDTAAVITTMAGESCLKSELEGETILLSPASFFNQKKTALPPAEFFVLEMETTAATLLLLVDKIVAEGIVPSHFESFPSLYPELARQCCPEIIVHNDRPVLLLDGTGLEDVRKELGNDYGEVSLAALRGSNSTDSIPLPHSNREETIAQPVEKLDDTLFKKIVSWTIARYLDRRDGGSVAINIDELPLEYQQLMQLQGVSDTSLQRVIDRTVHKCGNFQDVVLEKLKDKTAGANL